MKMAFSPFGYSVHVTKTGPFNWRPFYSSKKHNWYGPVHYWWAQKLQQHFRLQTLLFIVQYRKLRQLECWFVTLDRRLSSGILLPLVCVTGMSQQDVTNPYHTISYRILSYHTTSYHAVPYYIVACHIMSYHIISCHIIPYHIIYHIMPWHIESYRTILYHILSCHIISFHIIPYNIIPCHTALYHIISHHIIFYRTVSYHNISRHIVPYRNIRGYLLFGFFLFVSRE